MINMFRVVAVATAFAMTPALAQVGNTTIQKSDTSVTSASDANDCSKPSTVSRAEQCRATGNGDSVRGLYAFVNDDASKMRSGKSNDAMKAGAASVTSYQALSDCDRLGQCTQASERPLTIKQRALVTR